MRATAAASKHSSASEGGDALSARVAARGGVTEPHRRNYTTTSNRGSRSQRCGACDLRRDVQARLCFADGVAAAERTPLGLLRSQAAIVQRAPNCRPFAGGTASREAKRPASGPARRQSRGACRVGASPWSHPGSAPRTAADMPQPWVASTRAGGRARVAGAQGLAVRLRGPESRALADRFGKSLPSRSAWLEERAARKRGQSTRSPAGHHTASAAMAASVAAMEPTGSHSAELTAPEKLLVSPWLVVPLAARLGTSQAPRLPSASPPPPRSRATRPRPPQFKHFEVICPKDNVRGASWASALEGIIMDTRGVKHSATREADVRDKVMAWLDGEWLSGTRPFRPTGRRQPRPRCQRAPRRGARARSSLGSLKFSTFRAAGRSPAQQQPLLPPTAVCRGGLPQSAARRVAT